MALETAKGLPSANDLLSVLYDGIKVWRAINEENAFALSFVQTQIQASFKANSKCCLVSFHVLTAEQSRHLKRGMELRNVFILNILLTEVSSCSCGQTAFLIMAALTQDA